MKNLFDISGIAGNDSEIFEELLNLENIKIERIISTGQKTKEGEWLEENESEWVILLQGTSIVIFESGEKYNLKKGDYLFIPSNMKHRVEYTSENPKCIWLAVHINKK